MDRFDYQDLDKQDNVPGLLNWLEKGELMCLIDETKGGIIGYIHKDHIEELVNYLNKVEKEELTMAKGYLFGIRSAAAIEKEGFNGHALSSINSYLVVIDKVIKHIDNVLEEKA